MPVWQAREARPAGRGRHSRARHLALLVCAVFAGPAIDAAAAEKAFWQATLTPNPSDGAPGLVGYRRPGLDLAGRPEESAGAGSIAPESVVYGEVAYRIDALAIVSSGGVYGDVWLRTDPRIPQGEGLQLEIDHADGTSRMHAIDSASLEDYGYAWTGVYASDAAHGWGTDGGDVDSDPDAIAVRLLKPAAAVTATVSPASVPESAAAATVTVTAGFADGEPGSLVAVPVTVTVGGVGDTAAAPADYAAVAPFTVTIPAGAASGSATVTVTVVKDSVPEAPERLTFGVAAAGHPSGAPGELAIEDVERVEIEYWRGTLSQAAPFYAANERLSGYFTPLASFYGSRLTPRNFRCCRGRQTEDSSRSVRVLGRARADGERILVLGMNGLVRGGGLDPAFAGAALRVDGRVRLLEDASVIYFAGRSALAWSWDAAGLPDPAEAPVDVRLTGPDHPVLEAIEPVSTPGGGTSGDRRYAVGETVEIALRFDEPVTVTGVPTLALAIGANTRAASYAYGSGDRTLVFAYTVAAADADSDGIDVGRAADAVTLGVGVSIVSARSALDAVYGQLDPEPFGAHRVNGALAKPAAPTLAVRDATVGEADGTVTMTVALSFASTSAVTATYATSAGTATAGSDYTTASATVTVPANQRTGTFTVAIVDDSASEGPEAFTVTLSSPSGDVAIAGAAATVTIEDDDASEATVGVAVPAGAGSYRFERELAGAEWTVSAASAPVEDVVVNVLVEDAGGDFVPESAQGIRQVTIAAGSTSATLAPVMDDATDEPHGSVTVRVLPGTGYAVDPARSEAAVTVRDDDMRGAALEFLVSPASGTVIEGGALPVERIVRTAADGTFTASGDLVRALPGLDLASMQLSWGTVRHLETENADIGVTASQAALSAADFMSYTAEGGGVGLEARLSLGSVTAAADSVAEGAERVVVALERTAGDAALLRPARHPGVPGYPAALDGGSFFRAALTVRDRALLLIPELTELAEGQRTTVRATMAPPHAAAFTVTLSLESTARIGFVGTNRTLSFAAGASESTGTVTLEAKRTAAGDGTADVVLTGTPSVTGVAAATTALKVFDAPAAAGAVLWETELTVGSYSTDDDAAVERYGYADTVAVTGVTAVAAGALAADTFEFQGVEYTVRRLTLGRSGGARVRDLGGEFLATDASGYPLPVGSSSLGHEQVEPNTPTSVDLGLEVEGKDGVTRLRRLQLEPDNIGVLAEGAAWQSLDIGTDTVTVRLIDFGPMAWWNGQIVQETATDRNGYWVDGGTPHGLMVPDAFELENASGVRVLYTVDRLTVETVGGAKTLRFSTTPDVPADTASLLVSRLDWQKYDPGPDPKPAEIYHVFPLTAAARSAASGVDYAFALTADTSALSGEAPEQGIGRALLVPMAGAGPSAPPPPGVDEIWRADVTVGAGEKDCRIGGFGAPSMRCRLTGVSSPASVAENESVFGDVSDWRLPIYSEPVGLTGIAFERRPEGRTDLAFHIQVLEIRHVSRFDGLFSEGLEIQGDYGARTHWLRHLYGPVSNLPTIPFLNVDPGHGWEAGEVHRARLVRARGGATRLRIFDWDARASRDLSTLALALKVGYVEALPRGVDTPVRVTSSGVSRTATIPARQSSVLVEMEIPFTDQYWGLGVAVRVTEPGLDDLISNADQFVPIVWPPLDSGEIDHWSARMIGEGPSRGYPYGYYEAPTDDPRPASVGSLVPNVVACCGAAPDSAAGRRIWGLGVMGPDIVGHDVFNNLFLDGDGLGLDGIVGARTLPDELRGTTLHLVQVTDTPQGIQPATYSPLATGRLPLDAAPPLDVRRSGSEATTFLDWTPSDYDNLPNSHYLGEYQVRLTGSDRAILTAVDVVSTPRSGTSTDRWYGAGETIAIRLTFDEPVIVIGAPSLTFELGSADATAAYAYGSGTRDLVFEYVVQAGDLDTDGIDVAAFPGAMTQGGGAVISRALGTDAVYGTHNPPVWPHARVDGRLSELVAGPDVWLLGSLVFEDAGAAPVTVVLPAEAPAPRSFSWATADGDAVAGSDYSASTGTVTVQTGTRTATFQVPVLDDTELEPDERFTARLTRSSMTLAEAQVTVIDDDMQTVTIAGPSLAAGGHLFEHESGAGTAWTLSRPASASSTRLIVNLTVAESGGDFVPSLGEGDRTVTFPAQASTVTFTPVVDDTSDESHGTVSVRLRSGTGYQLPSEDGLESTVAVRDDDGDAMATFRFDPAALTVQEGSSAGYDVVAETVADGTFTEVADLGRVFAGSSAFAPVPVTATGVTADADDFEVHAPRLSFAFSGFAAITDGTGLEQSVAVPDFAAIEDSRDDDGETVELSFGNLPARTAAGTPSTLAVTLREKSALTLVLGDAQLAEGDAIDSGERTTVTATVDPPHGAPFTATVGAASDDGARWEFVGTNRTLSFTANAAASTGTVRIRALANEVDDGDVEVTVTATPDTTGVNGGEATLTVTDDDLPKVTIAAPALATAPEGNGNPYLFEFEAAKRYAVTVHPDAVQDLTTRAGWLIERDSTGSALETALDVKVTVSETGDFVASADETTHTVAFAADEPARTFKIVTDDDDDEAHGTVTATLETSAGVYDIAGTAASPVDIRDDDGGVIRFTVEPLDRVVAEGKGAAFDAVLTTVDAGLQQGTFTAAADIARALSPGTGPLFGKPVEDVALRWFPENVETSSADYTAFSHLSETPVASFAKADGESVFVARTALEELAAAENDDGEAGVGDDTETIADERLIVKLAASEAGVLDYGERLFPATRDNIADLTGNGSVVELDGDDFIAALVRIAEDEGIVLSLTRTRIAEGDDDDGEETTEITATVEPPQRSAFTATVTAGPGGDDRWEFVGANRTFSFAADVSEGSGAVTIRARHNDTDDDDLLVTVTATPDNASGLEASTASLTVVDDELPTVTLMLDDAELTEGETAMVTAMASSGHDAAFSVSVSAPASDRHEFTDANRTLSFAESTTASIGTVRIRAVQDELDQADIQGIQVTGTSSVVGIAVVPVTFSVLDDDLPKVSIEAPGLATDTGHVFEAEVADVATTGGPWVLTREGVLNAALAVTVAVSESGGDFVAATTEAADQTVTFAATGATANYTPVTADTTDGNHGTVTVTLRGGADYDIEGDAAATADVRDDDGTGAGALLVLGAEPATLTVAEGDAAQVSVTAATVADGTFTEPGDPGRVFAGATSATVNASTGGGDATAGTDYTALASNASATVRFADLTATDSGRGLRLATPVALPAVQTAEDEIRDDEETFVVTLAKAPGTDARIGLAPATATATIVEGPPDGTLRICGADGQCVTGAKVSCPASDLVCVNGLVAEVPVEGRLEVAWNGEYGTVCDDYWTNTDADVACRDIGHAAGQRSFGRSHFGGAARGVPIWFDDVECLGSETTLAECPRYGGTDTAGRNNCSRLHTEDAGVRCLEETTATPTVEVRPETLTVAPGDTARYWLSLTKRPDDRDFWAAPEASAGGAVTVSPDKVWMTNDERGWSFARWVDVTVSGGARAGGSHTITHETTVEAYLDGSVPAVPDVTVTVAEPSSSGVGGRPLPAGASASGGTVTVTFGAPLDSAFAPSAADYVVLAGAAERRVAAAHVKGADLVLELAGGLPAGAPVRVAYPAAPSSPLADAAGRAVAPFELAADRFGDGFTDGSAQAPWPQADGLGHGFADGLVAGEAAPKREGAAGLAAAVAAALRDAPEPSAATLWAPRRGVVDLSELAALSTLRRVNLSGNAVTDLGPLAGLADLERLDLSDNAVTDAWPLSGLAGIEVLDLSGNRIADVTALGGLPRLKVLELGGNAVADVSPLLNLTELRYLGLAGNRIADATPLSHLAGLLRLDLSRNRVADVEPLGNLSGLVWLRLPGNRLERVDALGRLTALRWVWMADNPPLAPDATAAFPAGVWVDTGADGLRR